MLSSSLHTLYDLDYLRLECSGATAQKGSEGEREGHSYQ